jgi:hypothetical protein
MVRAPERHISDSQAFHAATPSQVDPAIRTDFWFPEGMGDPGRSLDVAVAGSAGSSVAREFAPAHELLAPPEFEGAHIRNAPDSRKSGLVSKSIPGMIQSGLPAIEPRSSPETGAIFQSIEHPDRSGENRSNSEGTGPTIVHRQSTVDRVPNSMPPVNSHLINDGAAPPASSTRKQATATRTVNGRATDRNPIALETTTRAALSSVFRQEETQTITRDEVTGDESGIVTAGTSFRHEEIEYLAAKIFTILKRRLEIEFERRGNSHPSFRR